MFTRRHATRTRRNHRFFPNIDSLPTRAVPTITADISAILDINEEYEPTLSGDVSLQDSFDLNTPRPTESA